MLRTYVVGGASDLVKQDLSAKLTSFGLNIIGHLDYEKARSGRARKTLPASTQVIVILSDMVNHSCANNYVKEAKRRDIYHLILPRKVSFWPKIIEQLIPLNERNQHVCEPVKVTTQKIEVKQIEQQVTVMKPETYSEENWIAALKAIPELITLATSLKDIDTVIEVVANDHNVSNSELQRRWNEIAGKSITTIRAVSKLPDVNSKVLVNMFRIPMATAAAYLAHASRSKKSVVALAPSITPVVTTPVAPSAPSIVPVTPSPSIKRKKGAVLQQPSLLIGQPRPLPVLPPLPPPIPLSQRPLVSIETLTVSGKLRDIQHLQRILQALQKSGQISRGLLIQR